MTASELIDKLKQYPANMRIVVAGYESGFDDIEMINYVSIDKFRKKQEWDGRYRERNNATTVNAVALLGNRT
jgi:hypothetical protein